MAARVFDDAEALGGASKLLIFGGSFDPPHLAHIVLPRHVRQQVGADYVVYVPAALSPHKTGQQPAPGEHRLAMLREALREADDAAILTIELNRAGDGQPSYTVDTLERLRQKLGGVIEIRLLIGSDQVPVFDKWYRAARIVELAEPLVMVRPPETKASLLATLPSDQRATWERRLVTAPAMDVSATGIRARLANGEPIDDLVPEPVARYIEEHGLYQNGTPEAGAKQPRD